MVHQKDGYRSEIHPPNPKGLARNRRRRARNRRFSEKAAFHGINWDSYNHYQLYDMIMSADPAAMGEQARRWNTLGEAINDTTGKVQDTVTRLLTTWRGPAAVRAAESNTDLAQWADLASYNATSIGAGLTDYTEAVERAQHAMPPPEFASAEQNFRDGYDVKGSGGPSTAILIRQLIDDQKPDADKDHAAKAEAVRVMTTYGDDSQRVHDTMPWFYDGPEVTTETPPGQPPQPPDPIGDDDPPGGRPPVGRPPVGTPIVGGVPGPDDGTTTAGFGEPAYGPGGSGPGGPGSGSGGPGYGVGGLGGPGSGSGADATRGGPGAAGAGPLAARGPGGTAGGAGGLGGARGGGGIGGAGGMYPPMAGGARGNGEDDAEHKNKYDDGLDLFDDLPPAYPPVFGA